MRIVLFLKLWLERLATPYRLPKVISKKVGDALLGVAANRQVCPTFSEITFGNHSNTAALLSP